MKLVDVEGERAGHPARHGLLTEAKSDGQVSLRSLLSGQFAAYLRGNPPSGTHNHNRELTRSAGNRQDQIDGVFSLWVTYAMSSTTTATREAVAAEVRAVAARKRVAQKAIASVLGISQQAMSRRWTGQLAFDVDELAVVADYLGIDWHDLLPPTPTAGRAHPTETKVAAIFPPQRSTRRRRSSRNLLTGIVRVARAA